MAFFSLMMLLDDTETSVGDSRVFSSVCKTLNLRCLRVIDVPTWHMAFTVSLKHYSNIITYGLPFHIFWRIKLSFLKNLGLI